MLQSTSPIDPSSFEPGAAESASGAAAHSTLMKAQLEALYRSIQSQNMDAKPVPSSSPNISVSAQGKVIIFNLTRDGQTERNTGELTGMLKLAARDYIACKGDQIDFSNNGTADGLANLAATLQTITTMRAAQGIDVKPIVSSIQR